MANRFLLPLAVLVLICGCLAAPVRAQAQRGRSVYDMRAERLGPLRLGMAARDAARNLPCRPVVGRERLEGATGEYVQEWRLPDCGLTIKMSGPRRSGPKTVAAVTATAPCRLVTSRGVGVGADEAAVAAAYGRFKDEDGLSAPGRTFLVGSIYGGLVFSLAEGRVTRLFLGAGAE
ncbi:hypothetical protein [Solidesulfovibrio sp.]|uniref:hypothetical protein n=1 Tax=Solidesulfovibrio sp. TaxID=2910990 RepID=UPI00260841B3|nr:hypothetical protein [Solidesulfovibrio sp.]